MTVISLEDFFGENIKLFLGEASTYIENKGNVLNYCVNINKMLFDVFRVHLLLYKYNYVRVRVYMAYQRTTGNTLSAFC